MTSSGYTWNDFLMLKLDALFKKQHLLIFKEVLITLCWKKTKVLESN